MRVPVISDPNRPNFTRLGNVDVTFLDQSDTVLGSTVTHEGLILSPVEASATRT